jgi:uncharacterized protein
MRLKNFLAILTVVPLLAMPLRADAQEVSQSHLEAAYETISTTRATAQFDNILPRIAEHAKQELISNRPDVADQLSGIVDEAVLSLAKRRGNLEEEVARIYARTFSEEELKAISAFYLSDAGQKLVKQTPRLSNDVGEAAKVWAAGVQRDLAMALREKLAEAEIQ